MKHIRAGEETIQTLSRRMPERTVIDGKPYISFRDVFWNLLINQVQGFNYEDVQKKVEKITTKPMSRKHRLRIAKQLRKAGTIK